MLRGPSLALAVAAIFSGAGSAVSFSRMAARPFTSTRTPRAQSHSVPKR
jgi:hypothetical protein